MQCKKDRLIVTGLCTFIIVNSSLAYYVNNSLLTSILDDCILKILNKTLDKSLFKLKVKYSETFLYPPLFPQSLVNNVLQN